MSSGNGRRLGIAVASVLLTAVFIAYRLLKLPEERATTEVVARWACRNAPQREPFFTSAGALTVRHECVHGGISSTDAARPTCLHTSASLVMVQVSRSLEGVVVRATEHSVPSCEWYRPDRQFSVLGYDEFLIEKSGGVWREGRRLATTVY